jgi:ribosomal protein S1
MHAHDIRLGDRFVFRIQELKTPLGGIWLEPERRRGPKLLAAVWAELQKHYEQQIPVGGRILNDLPAGYAVGIAGVVGVLPWSTVQEDGVDPQLCRKLGTLQPFLVQKCDAVRQDLQVRFATGRTRKMGRSGVPPTSPTSHGHL